MTGPFDEQPEKLSASFNIPIFSNDMKHDSALCNCFSNLSLDSASFSSPVLSEDSPLHLENGCLALGTSLTHSHGVRVVTRSDSGCVACVPDSSASAVERPEWTVARREAASGHTTAIPVIPSVKSVGLDWDTIQRIANRRIVVLQAVAEGRVSADLFYALDEDSDLQLHICLYDTQQYRTEAWTLLSGSRPDWLSIQNKQGLTPLMVSVMYGADVEMVRALSLLSVALPLSDCRGNTALHYAVHFERVELVDAMLLDPTPEEYQLIQKFHEHMAQSGEAFQLYSFEEVLLRHRQAVSNLLSSRNVAGETPLYFAVKTSNLEVTRRLLAMHSDPRIQELTEGKTALHQAVIMLQTEIVRALLSYPSPHVAAELVNMRTLEGVTPLHAARRITCNQLAHKAALDEIIAILKDAGGPVAECKSDEDVTDE